MQAHASGRPYHHQNCAATSLTCGADVTRLLLLLLRLFLQTCRMLYYTHGKNRHTFIITHVCMHGIRLQNVHICATRVDTFHVHAEFVGCRIWCWRIVVRRRLAVMPELSGVSFSEQQRGIIRQHHHPAA